MLMGHEVIVMDKFFTGAKSKVAHWLHHPNFLIIEHDVTEPLALKVDEIYHMASPASPPKYQMHPIRTLKTNIWGTENILKLAKENNAKFLLTSTSEVYGDPLEHP